MKKILLSFLIAIISACQQEPEVFDCVFSDGVVTSIEPASMATLTPDYRVSFNMGAVSKSVVLPRVTALTFEVGQRITVFHCNVNGKEIITIDR